MRSIADALTVAVKELRIEARRLDGIASMVFLASVVTLVLAISLGPDRELAQVVGPGVLWVSSLLAGTVGLGRLLERERRHGGFTALLLAPVSRTSLFLGKAAALTVLLLVTDAVLVPLTALLFRLPLLDHLGGLVPLLALGAVGFASVATLLGAIALRAGTGDLLLGAVAYPLLVPVLVGGVKGTAALLEGGGAAELQPWLGLVLVADALYLVAGLWLFEAMVEE